MKTAIPKQRTKENKNQQQILQFSMGLIDTNYVVAYTINSPGRLY